MIRLLVFITLAALPALPRIFPEPRETRPGAGAFVLDAKAVIALPPNATAADRRLAAFLQAELSDRRGLALRTVPLAQVKPGERAILMGTVANPAVRARAVKAGWRETPAEGYLLDVSPAAILVAGADERGAFYGLQSLRQSLGPGVPSVRIRDWPRKPFRAIKLYLPGRENIAFFKRFVRDFAALYKFNRLVLEMNAAMRLERHPELNAGWREFARDLNFSRRERPRGARGEAQDSAHHDTADGGVLEKEEVEDLLRWARLHHLEVIPELPALTHCYYLLTRHRELAEDPEAEWPDTWCPSLPESRKLYLEVLDEYLEVMKPAMVHIGHDEWRVPWGVCARCRGKHYGDLFGENVRAIHAHLAARGVKTAMWADHLIERLRGAGPVPRKTEDGREYVVPGGLTPEQVRRWIPRDVLMFNWFWNEKYPGQGEVNDAALEEWGFRQVYGNMTPEIPDYDRRVERRGVLGGAPSSWAATTAFNFGKDLVYEFLGTAAMLWSARAPVDLAATVRELVPEVRRNFSGVEPPSAAGDPVVPLTFEGKTVRVGEDVTSVIFLHAAARRGRNAAAYRAIYNFADTAELMGWYEVVYEDGFTVTVPVRYQVNVLESSSKDYCYGADAVETERGTFYRYEWVTPRLGKAIREIRLHGDGVILAAVSVVKMRPFPDPVRAR